MYDRVIKVIKRFLLLLFLGITYAILVDKFHIGFVCVFHEVTGYLCPGCGITRCIISIFKGDLNAAFHYNMLVFVSLPFVIIYFIYWLYNYIKGNENYFKIDGKLKIVLLVITLLFGVIRNFL